MTVGVNTTPSGFALKVYMTQDDALSDTNPLGVQNKTGYDITPDYTTGAVSSDTADLNANKDTATAHAAHPDGYYHYFIFEEYWYRIESTDLVNEFEIDWDDGEDNSPEKSNTSVLKLKNPQNYAVTSHIYTTHGAHYPLIRCKSSNGFWSKWYTPASADNDFKALDSKHRVDSNLYDSGNNNFSNVTQEKYDQPRIPILCPANKPPVCVLKSDRKRIFAGIDNSYLGIADIDDASTDPTVTIHSENTTRDDVYVRVLYLDSGVTVSNDNARIQEVKKKHSETIVNCRRILKVELYDNRETTDATVTNKLASGERIHIVHTTEYSDVVSICYVSLGNPVVEEEKSGFYATLDATESITRASNVGLLTKEQYIGAYWFDLNRDRTYGGTLTNRQATGTDSNAGYTTYITSDETTGPIHSGVTKVSYSHNPANNMLDDNNRFLTEGRLIEAQVKDNSISILSHVGTQVSDRVAGDYNNITDSHNMSLIEHAEGKSYWNGDTDNDGVIEINTSHSHVLRKPLDLKNYSIMYRTYDGHTGTPTWTDLGASLRNIHDDDYALLGTSMAGTSLTSGNYQTFVMIAKDRKFDKIFIRTLHNALDSVYRNISHQGDTDGNWPSVELQLFYPAHESGFSSAYVNQTRFKPLKFIDNTSYDKTRGKSLCRSGLLSFDTPSDWVPVKKTTVNANLGTDNFLDNLANPWDVESYAIVIAIGVDASSGGGADANLAKLRIPRISVADSQNEQYLEIIDPTCLSLNNLIQAQGISFNRKGKYQVIENRLGISEIRKIGASGGQIKFGGVDLQGDPNSSRDTCYKYQRDATPVFLDVNHKNGDFTRFFGTITEMSEDHPTGALLPKYALSLVISSISVFNSSGEFISSGMVSLGGEMDESRFVGFGGHT